MSDSYTWTYSFKLLSKDCSIQVTTSTTNQSGSYADLSILGSIGGKAITALVPDAFGYSDNVEGIGDPTYYDGVDQDGLGFSAGGVVYDLYKTGDALSIEYGPDYTYNITDPVFSTDAPPCYLRGTLIATPQGERPVEDLRIGDPVCSAVGGHRAIKWIGRRSFDGRFLRRNLRMMPIRFRAGSLDTNVPRRDLLVSPDHAMFLEGCLIPADALVNGASILPEHDLPEIEYFHVELDTHDLILAEGAPSESFLDLNSRSLFHNAAEYTALYPGNVSEPSRDCAPRVDCGAVVDRIRARLAARAIAIGHIPPVPMFVPIDAPGIVRGTIPAGIGALYLVCASTNLPGDQRRLGALLSGITIDGGEMALTDPRCVQGFHPVERQDGRDVRWTGGHAVIAVPTSTSERALAIDVIVLATDIALSSGIAVRA